MMETVAYTIILIIFNYILGNSNLLFKMLTIDSLYNAIHFMRSFINNNLSESQIITESNALYLYAMVDRYIYYLLLYGIYKAICLFVWQLDINVLYYGALVSVVPHILNMILGSEQFMIIRRIKEHFVKIIVSKVVTGFVKFVSKVYLDKKIILKNSEILILMNDYNTSVNYLKTILKNVFVVCLLTYIKSYDKLYYGIIKYFYNYKTGELLSSYNNLSAKEYLINIVDNKKWDELTKPNTYKSLLCLFLIDANPKTSVIHTVMTRFNYNLIKLFTFWTIASVFDCIYIIPGLSMCVLLYERFVKNRVELFMTRAVIIMAGFACSLISPSHLIINIICNFGKEIIFNKVTHIILKTMFRFVHTMVLNILMVNRDITISYGITVSYILALRYLDFDKIYLIIGLNLVANILMSVETKKQIIFALLLMSTYLSSFNTFHVFYNTLALFIITGLLDIPNMVSMRDMIIYWFNHIVIYVRTLMNRNKPTILIISDNYNSVHSHSQDNPANPANPANKFKLMDLERFPSMSKFPGNYLPKFPVNFFGLSASDSINGNNMQDSVSIDDEIFNRDDDDFIDGISIGTESNKFDQTENANGYRYANRDNGKKDKKYDVVHNYL